LNGLLGLIRTLSLGKRSHDVRHRIDAEILGHLLDVLWFAIRVAVEPFVNCLFRCSQGVCCVDASLMALVLHPTVEQLGRSAHGSHLVD